MDNDQNLVPCRMACNSQKQQVKETLIGFNNNLHILIVNYSLLLNIHINNKFVKTYSLNC